MTDTTQQEREALLPCPCCGSPAHFFKINDIESCDHGGEGIRCTRSESCLTTGLMFACWDDVKPKLAEIWNRRATLPQREREAVTYEVWQGDICSAVTDDAKEASHYAAVYAHDGPVQVFTVYSRKVNWEGSTIPQRDEPVAEGKAVGEAVYMPGTEGFTMACFKASDVPAGTALYTTPPSPSVREVQADEPDAVLVARYRWLRNRPGQIGATLWPHAPWTQESFEMSQDRFDLCIDEEIAAELARQEERSNG